MSRNAKTVLMGLVRGNQELVALLPDGENSLFPNAEKELSETTPTPFIRVVMSDVANTDDIVYTIAFEFWVYDKPSASYWTIDKIHGIIRKQMDGLVLGDTAQGILDRLQQEYISGEATDDQYNKLLKFARYRSWLVA